MHRTPFLMLFMIAIALRGVASPVAEVSPALDPQPRENEWWQTRHAAKLAESKTDAPIRLVFVGDSITHGWENAGADLWAERFAPYGALNIGFSGDRTEHVLWRLGVGDAGEANNEIAGLEPELFVVMIGTNNTGHGASGPEDTAAGVTAIVDRLHEVCPDADVLLLAVFPRAAEPSNPARVTNDKVNQMIAPLGNRERVEFVDLADVFLEDDGTLPESVMPDLLHPNQAGYRLWADAVTPIVERYVGEQP